MLVALLSRLLCSLDALQLLLTGLPHIAAQTASDWSELYSHHDNAAAVLVALASALSCSLDALQLLLWAEASCHVPYAQDPAHALGAFWVITYNIHLSGKCKRTTAQDIAD